ncbi:ABC transporter ATP-binding protein [Arachnia rubra]|uniref:ABC transporter ATP-binding protein n=1 Tax=Arachnia rubra TaxID=1547448 RepID=UPI001CC578F4|nr:ABC transporter ATP-binding protein [Arachnia rubra]BCR81760.1 ABC transporter [Arachnia rubra]
MSGSETRPFVLEGRGLHLGYAGGSDVVAGLDVAIETGSFSVIVGPNACGKSTLLRSLSKVLPPRSGSVLLDSREIAGMRPKAFAREVGFLAQSSIAPEGITVHELVSRGRYPYQSVLHQWSDEDDEQVSVAMERTNVSALAQRRVSELSGGQRQRVWIAMALAQQTRVLLLDEPTTYLDLAHQVEVLELCRELNQVLGTTVVAVLHDLNQACRYAGWIIAMRDGQILTQGSPQKVMTAETVEQVFGLEVSVTPDPVTGTPLVLPAAPRTYTATGLESLS